MYDPPPLILRWDIMQIFNIQEPRTDDIIITMNTPHPTTLLLDSIFEAIRDAMADGDQALADALAKVLSRATQTQNVERRATVLRRPFGLGDGLDLIATQAKEARARLYAPAGKRPGAVQKAYVPVREPNPAPLGLGVVPSRQFNRPTFLRGR